MSVSNSGSTLEPSRVVFGAYASLFQSSSSPPKLKKITALLCSPEQTNEEVEAREGRGTLDLSKVMRQWRNGTLNLILLLLFDEQPPQCLCSDAVVRTNQFSFPSRILRR